MKLILSVVLFAVVYIFPADAQQSIVARYTITHPISLRGEAGKEIPVVLEFEGRIYSQENQVLLYMRPLFLDEYPDGKIIHNYPGGQSRYSFSKDSMHLPELYRTDSMRKWAIYNDAGNSKLNECITFRYEPGFWQWNILPDKKKIDGIECRHARKMMNAKGEEEKVFWDIWFAPHIPFDFSFMGLQSVPGLIVEADNLQSGFHFKLKEFKTGLKIPAATFWPEIFQRSRFTDIGEPQTPAEKKAKKKQEKRLDIMGQQ